MNIPLFSQQMEFFSNLFKDYKKIMLEPFLSYEQRIALQSGTDQKPRGFLPPLYQMLEAHIRAQFTYRTRPYPGKITIFETADQQFPNSVNYSKGWQMLCVEDIETHPIPGNFFSMWSEPYVEILGKKLADCLKQT